MRNLKRALSLALASVMLMGMMVVGSSAASFPDVSNKDNTEAISVLNAVGVMLGDEDTGNFRPDDNVTRNEMAVILAKLILGKDADKYVGTCPFTDVPTWAQKYVAACYDNKIVAGRTESVYDGSAVVTAQEAAAMVLRVLGYEKLESTGTNWAQPVVAKANELRLFADVGSSASAPLNRNQVAQLSLNALQATMVTSDVEKDIVVEGVVTIPGKVTYTERTTNKFDYTQSNGAYKKDVSDEKLQLCENLYEKDLRLVPGTDSFGRPANIWSYKTDEIVTVAEAADASYIKAVKAEDLYKDLGLKSKTNATVFVDGAEAADFSIAKTGTNKIGGNGVVVDAYKDDDGKVTISVINPYVGEVTKVTEAKDNDARTVTVGGMKFETEGFDVDDVVVYTKADGKIKTMYLAETVENVEVTKTVGDSEFVADGETYKFAAQWASKTNTTTDLVDNKTEVKKENKVDLYLDSNNFVVKVALNEGVTDYAYVIDIDVDGGKLFKNGTPYAKLLLTDGTVVEAELKFSDYTETDNSKSDSEKQKKLEKKFEDFIVEYSRNSKDVYKLTAKSEKMDQLADSSEKIVVENGKAKMTLGNNTIYADSKTIFLTDDGDDNYKAYTGYDAVPDLEGTYSKTASANAAYAYYCKDNGTVATVVYVLNTTGSSDDIVFLLGKECGDEINVKDGDNYYECPAVVNGEIETVKLDAKIKDNRLLKSITWANEDEEIISAAKSKDYDKNGDNYYVNGKVTKKLTNGNITVGSNSYRVADDAQVFVYSDKIESSSKTAIAAGDTGLFVVNDGKVVTIFYTEAADNSGSNGGNSDDVGTVTNDIVTAPSGAEVKVETKENGSSTITVSGDSVNPVVPKEDRKDMYDLFGSALFPDADGAGEKNGVPKNEYAIFTVDVLANAEASGYYKIVQTNDTLKELYDKDENVKGNVKTKVYNVADIQDGISLVLKSGRGATLSVTPVLDDKGTTVNGKTIVITIKNSATFVSRIEVNSDEAAGEAVKDPANQEIVITGDVTLTEATKANQKVIVEADKKVTVGKTGNLGVFTGEGTVVVNEKSGNINVVDTNVEVGAITGTVKVEGTTKITVTATPGTNGKIEIAANAKVDIKTDAGVNVEAEDLDIKAGAVVTINGNLVKPSTSGKARTTATGLTIPAKTEVVVNGKIGEGVVITIEGDNGLTVNGEVEKGAQITAKTQEAFKIGDKTKVNEAITLSLSDKDVQLTEVVPFIPWKISGKEGQGYAWPSDVSTNTVFVFVKKNGTENGNFYLTKGDGTDKYLETKYDDKTDIGWGAYFSLDKLTDGSGKPATDNPFKTGETWVTHTFDGNGNEHVHSFTAWAGPEAQGEA